MPRRSRNKERDVRDFFNTSGNAMNFTRPSSAPTKRRNNNVIAKAVPLHIDLNNFEDPKFEDSKYILTSPRSLEACARLAIKPAELLYAPLIDFQEDLVPEGYSIRTIYEIYDQHERERQNKLALCKEERAQIVDEDKRSGRYYMSPIVGSTFLQSSTLTGKSSTRETQGGLGAVDEGSLQRARTAWSTSVGHDRVTQRELSKRADDMHRLGHKRENVSLVRKESAGNRLQSAKKKLLDAKYKRKQEAERKAKKTTPTKEGATPTKEKTTPTKERATPSKEKTTPTRAVRPWIKDPGTEASPIADKALKEKITAMKGSGQVTMRKRTSMDVNRHSMPQLRPTDQKILQLMIAKKEEEKKLGDPQVRERQARQRNATHNQRAGGAQTPSKTVEKNEVTTTRRRSSTSKDDTDMTEDANSPLDAAKQRQMEIRKQRVLEKRQRDMERKKSVEERLELQRKEADEYNQRLQEKHHNQLQRAQSMRTNREQQKAMQARLRNSQATSRHNQKMDEIKRKSCEDLLMLKTSVDGKLAAAEQKYTQVMQQKENKYKSKGRDLERKISSSRQKQKDLEDEMAAWKEEMDEYRQMQEKKAEELAREATDQKKLRAMEDRIHKEKLRRDNLERLLSEEHEWRDKVEANIAMKDARSKNLAEAREEMIQESRALSQNSQRLREELRQHYSMNDLDKLNKQAAIEARFAFRQTPTPLNHTDSQLSLLG